ncbi:MAG: hypothetical protein R3A10_07790 [Caldilineaceae bacterium]
MIERIQLERIAKRYGIDMEELPLPSDEDVTSVVSACHHVVGRTAAGATISRPSACSVSCR